MKYTSTARLWPFAVPIVWCLLIFGVMRSDAVIWRQDVPFAVKSLVYDECDLAAIAIRGANAYTGRLPGRDHEPPIYGPDVLGQLLDGPQPPLQPRFYLEYPTPALGLFWLGFAIQPGMGDFHLPPVVADYSHQFAVAYFIPRDEAETRLWTHLSIACRFYVLVMTVAALVMMGVIGRGYEPGQRLHPAIWLLVLPGAMYFSLNRFDILPACFSALAFACLGRDRRIASGALLAVAVMLKVYPVLFVPIILRYLGVTQSVRWLLAFSLTGIAGLLVSTALTDWEATTKPVLVQMARKLEAEDRMLYGRLLPKSLAESGTARNAILIAAVLAACATRPRDLSGVLRRSALVLIVFVNLALFWSPQWIIWFLPLLVPLARDSRRVFSAVIVLDLIAYFTFPICCLLLMPILGASGQGTLMESTIWLRTAGWLWLLIALLLDSWKRWKAIVKPAEAQAKFQSAREELLSRCFQLGAESGTPKGVKWVSLDSTGETVFAQDQEADRFVAMVPCRVQFEPLPGSDLEEVPQAAEPREVVALLVYAQGVWQPTRKLVFNLSVAQMMERSNGRYRVIDTRPTA